jgi:hypothetical protein
VWPGPGPDGGDGHDERRHRNESRVGVQVDHGGVGLLVTEPKRDHGGVHAGVQQGHRAAVPQGVRGDLSAGQGRAGGGVLGDESLDGVAGQRFVAAGGEQDVVGLAGEFGQPSAQDRDGGAGERGDPVLASLAVAAHVGAGPEVQVVDAQAGQLGHPQSGLDGEGEQGVVASAEPGATIGRGQQRVGLGCAQVVHDGPVAALGRNRQHPLDHRGIVGGVQRGVAKQRPDRGQPGVAGAHAVAPLGLQVGQERHDQGGVQVGDVQVDGLFAGRVRRVGDQEPQAVAVGGDGVRAGLALSGQPVGEEALQDRGEPGHRRAPYPAFSSRSAAASSSSGVACRYQ